MTPMSSTHGKTVSGRQHDATVCEKKKQFSIQEEKKREGSTYLVNVVGTNVEGLVIVVVILVDDVDLLLVIWVCLNRRFRITLLVKQTNLSRCNLQGHRNRLPRRDGQLVMRGTHDLGHKLELYFRRQV